MKEFKNLIISILVFSVFLCSCSGDDRNRNDTDQLNVPDGAIWNKETIHYATAPLGFEAVLGWFQVATMKINHDPSIAATIEIDWQRLIAIAPNGTRTVVYEENFDTNGQLPATNAGLFLREPEWFPPGNYNEPITNSNISDGILTIDIAVTPNRIAHWWTGRVVTNENYKYAVEVRVRITGELMFQMGSDYWRTLDIDYNVYDSTCQTSNNCEAWVSDWYGDTNNQFVVINVPLSY